MLKRLVLIPVFLFLLTISFAQDVNTYIESGRGKFDNKDYAGAIDDYDKAIALDEKSDNAYYYRAKAKASLKNYFGATEDLTKAIKLGADSELLSEYYFSRAIVKTLLNEYHSSIGDFDEAIKLKPTNSEYLFFKAFVYISLDKKKEACECWKEAKKVSLPDNTDAEQMLKKYCK
jgi:tetratricopeptide (TPR) repeat protein